MLVNQPDYQTALFLARLIHTRGTTEQQTRFTEWVNAQLAVGAQVQQLLTLQAHFFHLLQAETNLDPSPFSTRTSLRLLSQMEQVTQELAHVCTRADEQSARLRDVTREWLVEMNEQDASS